MSEVKVTNITEALRISLAEGAGQPITDAERALKDETVAAVKAKIEQEAATVPHISAYMALKAQIAALEAKLAVEREAVERVLIGAPGATWRFPGLAVVTIVKGRLSEKLDRAKLAKGGVDGALLDAATVRTEGKPSMRIAAAEDEAQ